MKKSSTNSVAKKAAPSKASAAKSAAAGRSGDKSSSSKSPANGAASSKSSGGSSSGKSSSGERSGMASKSGGNNKSGMTSKQGGLGKSGMASKAGNAGRTAASAKSSGGGKSSASKNATGGRGVKAKSDAAAGLRDLFIDELKDIYWAEKALTKALPKMAKNATSEELVSALQDHLQVTQGQVQRAEQVFEMLGEKAQAKKCEAMAGLVKESEEIMESTESGPVRDAGIISAGQKVEHYEIATYGTLVAFAKILGEDDAAALLQETLDEEKEADEKLSDIAESAVNIAAADEDDNEDGDSDDDAKDDDEDNAGEDDKK